MIERMQFHDLPLEDPVVHLKKFLGLTDTMKSPTSAPNYINWQPLRSHRRERHGKGMGLTQ